MGREVQTQTQRQRQLDVRRQNGKWSFGHRRRPSCCEACEPAAGAALRCVHVGLAQLTSNVEANSSQPHTLYAALDLYYCHSRPSLGSRTSLHLLQSFSCAERATRLSPCLVPMSSSQHYYSRSLGPRMSVGANTATVDRTAASSTASQPDSIKQSPSPRHKILCYTNSSLAGPAVALLTLSSISSFDPQGRYACTRALCKVDCLRIHRKQCSRPGLTAVIIVPSTASHNRCKPRQSQGPASALFD